MIDVGPLQEQNTLLAMFVIAGLGCLEPRLPWMFLLLLCIAAALGK
jgi:hypothetical protein